MNDFELRIKLMTNKYSEAHSFNLASEFWAYFPSLRRNSFFFCCLPIMRTIFSSLRSVYIYVSISIVEAWYQWKEQKIQTLVSIITKYKPHIHIEKAWCFIFLMILSEKRATFIIVTRNKSESKHTCNQQLRYRQCQILFSLKK